MRDPVSSMHFKISAARGILDVALLAALGTHIAAWAGLGRSCAFAHDSGLGVIVAGGSGVAGVLTLWLPIRVAIDRRLFASLARANVTHDLAGALSALDEALLELGWIDDRTTGRAIDARMRGVFGLLKRVIALLLMPVRVLCIVIPLHRFKLAWERDGQNAGTRLDGGSPGAVRHRCGPSKFRLLCENRAGVGAFRNNRRRESLQEGTRSAACFCRWRDMESR
jgi:hypothetical protein